MEGRYKTVITRRLKSGEYFNKRKFGDEIEAGPVIVYSKHKIEISFSNVNISMDEAFDWMLKILKSHKKNPIIENLLFGRYGVNAKI